MKFPIVTVVLVSAALGVVLWDQSREAPAPVNAARFTDLAQNPVARGVAVDWITDQAPEQCEDGTAFPDETRQACLDGIDRRTGSCQRAMADQFPETLRSEAQFRDLSITLLGCLVPRSGRVE
ncbi:MAG TPA: hypothetical protein VFM78_10090 [Marinobacter sp.]|nr:hypothetical protein [Marinobacter sp.]